MKLDIKNRHTGEIQFTAEINADKNTPNSIKIGLAVKWGVENKADLREADLWGANLREANLWGADLRGADLREADLREADLRGANLWGADLREADLWEADLREADLRGADLRGADLIIIQGLFYPVIINNNKITIGCEAHTAKEWKGFTNVRIKEMDGSNATDFWNTHKKTILMLADTCRIK